MLLFQVGENWVSKRDKIRNDLQGSQDSLETKRKRYYHGLYDIFFFFKNYQARIYTTSNKKNDFWYQNSLDIEDKIPALL